MNSIYIDGKALDEKTCRKFGLNVIFKDGNKNLVKIDSPFKFDNFNITVSGDNNSVIIQANSIIKNTWISLNAKMNDIRIRIGKNFICKGANINASGDFDEILIGDNCEFDEKIYLSTQDGHTIYDIESHKVINKGTQIVLGTNVYLGYKTLVMKNVILGNHIIVMPCSVVSKSFLSGNLKIAGQPAEVIRKNVARKKISLAEYKRGKYNESNNNS